MSKKRKSGPFGNMNAAQEEQWGREVRLQYDPDLVRESNQRWNGYSAAQKDYIKDEGNRIYAAIAEQIEAGLPPTSAEVQALLDRWQAHLRYFYEPSLDVLRGLGELYNTSPDFIATFQQLHAELPAYLQAAIAHYVDDLETQAIIAMLEADETEQQRTKRLSK